MKGNVLRGWNDAIAERLRKDMVETWAAGMESDSDRVVAIVGAAYLDGLLDSLLRAVFASANGSVDRLLGLDGPLGSNGVRIHLTYALGLISQDQQEDLKAVAKIRNRFAHTFQDLSFSSPQVLDLCANLKQLLRLMEADGAKYPEFLTDEFREALRKVEPRTHFTVTVGILAGRLLQRVRYVRPAADIKWYQRNPDRKVAHPVIGP